MEKSLQGGYDGTGRHELRNMVGQMMARGTYDFCLVRLQQLQSGSFDWALKNGWSIRPYVIPQDSTV